MSNYFNYTKNKNSLLEDKEIEKLAEEISEKIVETMGKYTASKSSISSPSVPAKSTDKEDDATLKEKIAKVQNKVHDIQKDISESLDSIDNIGNVIVDIAKINTMHIKSQSEVALKSLEDLYKGSQGLITQADEELKAFQEERKAEEEERKLAEEEAAYQHQQDLYDRDLAALESSLATETNIRNAKKLEAELEEKRRSKREAQEKRKADIAEKKRQEALDKQEATLLQEKQLREWEYEVSKTQIQNDVGYAIAESEKQAAIISKTTSIAGLSAKMAVASADAAIAMASMNFPKGIALMAAVAASGAQIGLISATPLPPAYIPSPLPPRPFAQGGIVRAVPGGLPISFGHGAPGVVAEAGVNELVMPLTTKNMQKFLEPILPNILAQQSGDLTYAPQINIHVDTSNSPEETLSYIRENLQRDLFDTVEEARRRFQIKS